MNKQYSKGTYGYDTEFFAKNNIGALSLRDTSTGASVLVVPEYQGRVMTSTSAGDEGTSYGWINHKYIESGKRSNQFNPFGGEERFWLGPEGGPFSVYFKKGDEQVFSNWKVPGELDTMKFDVVSKTGTSVSFRRDFSLINASGTKMDIGVERNIKLLNHSDAEKALNLTLGKSLSFVAYETENTLINKGQNNWTMDTGFLSIWLLGMFNPSENGVVVIPFKKSSGKVVNDDYFGKVPPERLKIMEDKLFFNIDGKYRSKIGISPEGALPYCGSYDPDSQTLTILWFSIPGEKLPYVNSKWGRQDDPLKGDVVNSYNDGPVEDGSMLGPFYEIESSSPAALLSAGRKITHTQRTFHISGDEAQLGMITQKLFNTSIDELKSAFK